MADDFSFCGRCGARLDAPPPEAAGERQVTCVFADVSGFTSLAERLEPEELHGVMRMAWDAVAAEIRRHEGFIEKYIGDAVVAVFGAPIAHDDDPRRALGATLGMLGALERVNTEIERTTQRRLALRVGVNTGVAMAGAIGDRESEYGVLGDAVNVAARLQQAAQTGEVLVGEATYRLAAREYRFEAHPPVLAKGKSEPIVTWRLVDRRGAKVYRARTPLIGRAALLQRLWDELALAEAGQGRAVSLVGEPGMGVSRVVQEILADPRATALRVAHVACTPYDRARPYAVLEEVLRGVLAITEADPLERARRLLADLLPSLEPEVRALILEMVGHPGLARPLAPGTRRRLMVRGARDVLRRIAETQPVLVIVEDAHDIDSPSGSALGDLVAALAESRALVLVTRRPGDPLPWARETSAVELRIEPLSPDDARALLRAASREKLDNASVEHAVAESAGSPALLEEVALGTSDVSKLPKEDRHVLRSAAVLGRAFDPALLRGAVGADADVDSALSRLVASALLEETPFGLRFRYGGLREAVYRNIPTRLRGDLHGRVALAIERHRPALARQRPELLALHLAPSPYALRAFDYAVRAAERALVVDDPDAAASHLRSAVDLAGRAAGTARDRAAILVRLAEIERLRGDDRAAREVLEALLAETSDPEESSRLRLALGLVFARAGESDRAAEHLAQAERDGLSRPADRAALALSKAYLASRDAPYEDASALAGEAARLAREAGEPRLELEALAALERAETGTTRSTRRRDVLLRALTVADTEGDYVRSAELSLALAAIEVSPPEERERYARDAYERCAQLADDAGRVRALHAVAQARLAAEDMEGAERALGDALALAGRDSEESASILHLLGEASLRSEDLSEAEAYLREALAVNGGAESHLPARCLTSLARIALRRGDLDAAASHVARADATVTTDCARCLAQLGLVAAELALARGDLSGARARLSRGLEWALRAQLATELEALRAVAERLTGRDDPSRSRPLPT